MNGVRKSIAAAAIAGSMLIGGVGGAVLYAATTISAAAASILRMAGRERPQAVRRQEMPRTRVHDAPLALGRQRTLGQRDGEDLIGS